MKTGVILEHYPLHRTSASEGIRLSVEKYSGKLMKNLRLGNINWLKYLEPIHLIKKYYGERFGFSFLYFMNYQAMLFWPALLGGILFAYQMVRYAISGDMLESIDTEYNGLYGLFLAIWSSIFVEGWRRKQNRMIFEWDMKSLEDVLQNDERKGKYHYMSQYNSETNTKVRSEIGEARRQKCQILNHVFNLIMVCAVIAVMVGFDGIFKEIDEITSDVIVNQVITSFFDPMTIVYALIMELLGIIFEYCTLYFINQRNYRFKQEYHSAISLQLFAFNCLNYFLPLAYIAIRKRNFQCLFTLLTLLLVLEQGKANLYKWLRPICCYRGKINKLKSQWEAEGYDLDKNIPTKREKIYHQVKLNDAMMDNENDVSVE